MRLGRQGLNAIRVTFIHNQRRGLMLSTHRDCVHLDTFLFTLVYMFTDSLIFSS